MRHDSFPSEIEQGFRWIRETISLIYAHHKHPLPMVALIFMYSETFGKVLCREAGTKGNIPSETKVSKFVETHMPKLWVALASQPERNKILGNYYRNGLVHQLFMKNGHAIHEDKQGDTSYVSYDIAPFPMSINIDRLVPEFQNALATFYGRLETEPQFLKIYIAAMSEA